MALASELVKNLRRFAKLKPLDWLYLAISAKELARARLHHISGTPESIIKGLQTPFEPNGEGANICLRDLDLKRMAWSISVAASRMPWRSDCLIQVLAADRWMRRHRLRGEFYLGVAKDAHGDLVSHAWMECGEIVVPNGETRAYHVVIGPPRR